MLAVLLHLILQLVLNMVTLDKVDIICVVVVRSHQDAHEVQVVAQILQQ